jgi:hypothetical protein
MSGEFAIVLYFLFSLALKILSKNNYIRLSVGKLKDL